MLLREKLLNSFDQEFWVTMKRAVILDTFGPVPMNQAALIAGQAQLVTVGASDYEDGNIPARPHFHCSSLCHCFLPLTEAIPAGG